MVHNKKHSIVVAGGGIGGLSAALGLAAKGCAVTVLEQGDAFGEIGAGIQLGPNAFHAMDYLGIGEAARRTAIYIDKLVMMDAVSGEQVAAIPVDAPFRQRFGNPYAVMHRGDLHRMLYEACRGHDAVTLLPKQRVLAYENVPGGARVRMESGETFAGDAVIGCDGLYSKLRAQLTGGDPVRLAGHVAYRAVLPIEQMPEDLRWNAAALWGGPKCHIVHYPLQGWKSFNIVATFQPTEGDLGHNEAGRREEVLTRFANAHPRIRKVIEIPKEWRRWVLGDREPIENWTDGRVTLLGDAAHPTLQYFAQGACMAMESAVALAHAYERHAGDLDAAFRTYQDLRMVRAYRLVLSSRMLGLLYHAEGMTRKIRNSVMGKRTPEEFYAGLAWLYGGTAISDDIRSA